MPLGSIWVTGAGEYAVWWLTNSTPPTVTLDAPRDAVRGNVTVGVRVGPDGRAGPIEWDVAAYRATIRGELLQFNVGTDIPMLQMSALQQVMDAKGGKL